MKYTYKEKIKIFKKAKEKGKAIGQFNFSTFSQFKGIALAAKKMNAPIILGTSEGESKFLGLKTAVFLRDIARKNYKIGVILNLDHGKSFEYIKEAIRAGYDMVHFDGSQNPLDKNIRETKKIVSFARKKGILVEGEIGYIKGESFLHKKDIKVSSAEMTKPEDTEKFVRATKVDFLAIAIGSVHGIYKNPPCLDQERLFMIKNRIGNDAFLVLHGGSGIKNQEIKKAIKNGIVKININTEIRLAWKKSLENILKKTAEITPYKILPKVENKIEKVVSKKIELFYY